jgi:hypothetical protein
VVGQVSQSEILDNDSQKKKKGMSSAFSKAGKDRCRSDVPTPTRHLQAYICGANILIFVAYRCIALRTMVMKKGIVYLQAGGGIVFDSDEYDE